ncbi:MAG: EAL domain-containing protein [Deltaproteobacteria bacterium]|nr:EAL domain-containing protein [Deltaproteobacteria bacterium]MBW2395893.1 EAL domain-containing protein [Deltaproteobacteria bacterium]
MSESELEKDEMDGGNRPPRTAVLPRLGDVLPSLVQQYGCGKTLGIVLVDGSCLGKIERSYGSEASKVALRNLSALVYDVAADLLDGDEVVVTGETGRFEIAVAFFRGDGGGGFYRNELPSLARGVEKAIERQGIKLVYPYSRRMPRFSVGYAAVQRNPFRGAENQIREALSEAREDADLQARMDARHRRRIFQAMVLAGEVSSVYEPIVDVSTKTVYGYEALVRGPEGSAFRSPLALFDAAEEEDLLFELDCLCRRAGLEGATEIPTGTALFLNIRPTSIHDPYFAPDELVHTLRRTNLRPSDVVFEISEQESIENFDAFREVRDAYRALGFRFALDDTGAGYASLQAVIELEPEFIKVDRALVTGLDTDPARKALLQALQAVANTIGAKIIGEGLDTLEELEVLKELEISFGQGWLFGKPTPLRAGNEG